MKIGFHVSVSGGLVQAVRRAKTIGCECLQIFVRNARGWRGRIYSEREISDFRSLFARYRISPLYIHSCYLVNLASPDAELRNKSLRAVADDMQRAALLGGCAVVTHTGHHSGVGIEVGLSTLARSLRSLLTDGPEQIDLLLENTAGSGTNLGADWDQFARLLDLLDGDSRIGICFDTCHAHAAGYRLDNSRWVSRTLHGFADKLDMERLRLIHLNDCQSPLGLRLDRHQHIGQGTIGDAGFRAFLRRRELRNCCAILETPFHRPCDDHRNIRHVRELMNKASEEEWLYRPKGRTPWRFLWNGVVHPNGMAEPFT